MKQNNFSTGETMDQILFEAKVPKSTKIKLIKELNHKSNINIHDGKLISHSKFISGQIQDLLIGKCRSRPESSFSTYSENHKNFSRSRTGNKCLKKTKLDGQVDFVDYNGNKFQGTYQNGIRVFGKMIYCQAKCSYEGSFFGEKFHGHGKLVYFDGRNIEGQWEQHFLIGNAIINYPNGDVYYGDVNKKLYKHGRGHLFLKNGDKYIGDFMNGSITGYGIFYKGENPGIEGHWMEGELVKKVKLELYLNEQKEEQTVETEEEKEVNNLRRKKQNQVVQSLYSPLENNEIEHLNQDLMTGNSLGNKPEIIIQFEKFQLPGRQKQRFK